jgi:hypothetical protein
MKFIKIQIINIAGVAENAILPKDKTNPAFKSPKAHPISITFFHLGKNIGRAISRYPIPIKRRRFPTDFNRTILKLTEL